MILVEREREREREQCKTERKTNKTDRQTDRQTDKTRQDKTRVYFLRPPAPGKGRTLYIIISSIHISRMIKTI